MAGYKVYAIAKSKVFHLGGGTLDYQNPKKDYYNFRNNLYLLTKNEFLGKLIWLLPLKLILDGIAGIKFLFEGKPLSTLAILKAHITFYINLPFIFERRNMESGMINRNRLNPPNLAGRYEGSIIWDYFIRNKKTWSSIFINERVK
ncbi:MAG: hypothetical protein IPO92_08520 [Saprospiraceae bacterium]|nr:hypothetical protein [Saprospiraceae bacterium]